MRPWSLRLTLKQKDTTGILLQFIAMINKPNDKENPTF